jgi:hypothetical protein
MTRTGSFKFVLLIASIFWSNAEAKDSVETSPFGESRLMARGPKDSGRVYDMIQDRRKILFFASASAIQEFDGFAWSAVAGTESRNLKVLGEGPDGRIYAAGDSDFGQILPDRLGIMSFQSFANLLPESSAKSAHDFIKVVATSKEALFLTETNVISYSVAGKNPTVTVTTLKNPIFTAAVTGDDAYILDETTGLSRWKEGQLIPIKGGNFFRTLAIAPTGDSKLAAATNDGILVLTLKGDDVTFDQIAYSDASQIRGRLINRLESFEGCFYLGFDLGGVVKVAQDGQTSSWTDSQKKLLGDDVSTHLADDRGNLWFVTKNGVGVFTRPFSSAQALPAQASSPAATSPAVVVSESQVYLRNITGTKSDEVQFGGVYFDKIGGVAALAPSDLNVTEIIFANNALRFQFATDRVAESDKVEFQTMIEGLDDKWSEFSNRSTREVTNLLWRNYALKMRAKFPDGSLTREFEFKFKVTPPWNEQLWFHCLEAGIFLSFMMLVVWIRITKKYIKAEEPLNITIVSTAVGYAFTKMGASSAIDSISGGAAFLSIFLGSLMGIFLKPIERKIEQLVYLVEAWLERQSRKQKIVILDPSGDASTESPVHNDSNNTAA